MNIGLIHPLWAATMRPVAEAVLTAACTQTRPQPGQGPLDQSTGEVTLPPALTIATLACRVERATARATTGDVAEQVVTTRQYDVQVPLAHTDVQVDDRFTITDVGPHGDPRLLGRVLRCTDAVGVTLAWTRILGCQDDEG